MSGIFGIFNPEARYERLPCVDAASGGPIRRLSPAHCLTVTPDRLDVRQFWRLEDTLELRLSDEVRFNRRRGRQAGALVPRLRACAVEVETALDELARKMTPGYSFMTKTDSDMPPYQLPIEIYVFNFDVGNSFLV